MATKQLNELPAATTFQGGDLVLVRKTSQGVDQSLTYEKLVDGIGNPAVEGFVATSAEANKVILTPANNATITKYYPGMKVSFLSPIDSDGLVSIKIGSLTDKELLKQGTATTATLKNDSYVEAVFIGDGATGKFYQTNDYANQNIYSNEYTAAGVVSEDQTATTLALTSAVGLKKINYYNGMSVLFTTPIDTKGTVLVNVDELGPKPLNDGTNDKIANDLTKDQPILATYDGTQFVKHRFATVNPEKQVDGPPLAQDGFHVTVKVGVSQKYSTLQEAVNNVIREFGEDGGNRKVKIELQDSAYTLNGTTALSVSRKNLSWITITSVSPVIFKYIVGIKGAGAVFTFDEAVSPILRLSCTFVIQQDSGNSTIDKIIYLTNGAALNIESSNMLVPENINFISGKGHTSDTCNIKDTTITGGKTVLTGCVAYILDAVTLTNFKEYALMSYGATIRMTGCIISTNSTTASRIITSQNDMLFEAKDCQIKGVSGQVTIFNGSKNCILTNCTVNCTGSNQTLLATGGADVRLVGGDYRGSNGTSTHGNIVALDGVVRLSGTVPGGATALNSDGKIITE